MSLVGTCNGCGDETPVNPIDSGFDGLYRFICEHCGAESRDLLHAPKRAGVKA